MRNILALIGLIVVVFAIVGHYKGWYSFQNATAPDGKPVIKLEVDKSKVQSDIKAGAEEIGKTIQGKE